MSLEPQPQLPPTGAIAPETALKATTERWFEYPIKVQPHHTDYSGTVWHGTYLTWLEAARVEYLSSMGIDFAELVRLGCDLPVVELSLRYHRSISLGQEAIVKTQMNEITGVRMNVDCRIESPDTQEFYVSGKVTLVAIDREKGKIMRQLPPSVKEILVKLIQS
ncbi:thioesterase superfamily protein [Rippkaea orientalis PCC 8801]|uniref:Thioesterase superfamily protein n=1 Tax=Rippkaea orientalis (strain PCC 8801 / RF-1) TaxID=41431 RepID=B7K283_RIPO1|nr:thioesterase family protein [Rippkaea orientalis]ACK65219.1 thioesterase superfamily protein [Rippkaea orientalis PCC 8801]